MISEPNLGSLHNWIKPRTGRLFLFQFITSVHYKTIYSHKISCLLYSSSYPSHVKNSIPYPQFIILSLLCSEDSDFSLKSEEMRDFFDKSGYPTSVIQAGRHRAHQIDRHSALPTSEKENNDRIIFTLTFHR